MAAPNKEVKELARKIASLEYRLNSTRTPQLAYSSIEDGAIVEYDEDGNEVAIIGKQEDGGHGYVPFTGPTPPIPAPATTEPSPGMFSVAWGGVFLDPDTGAPNPLILAPTDFARVEVHVGTTADFAPEVYPGSTTRAGVFPNAGGGQLTHVPLDGAGTYYVRLVAASTAGKFGPASAAVAVEVPSFVDLTELENDLAQLEIDLAAAADEIAQTGAELSLRLDEAGDAIAAAEVRLDDAEGRLATAEGDIAAASQEIADTGAALSGRLDDADDAIAAAEVRLGAAEGRLTTAEGNISDASDWIDGTGAQLGTNLAAAQDMLDAAFPSGAFDVDAAIDAAVATGGGNVTTYSNISEANKPGPAPTSTAGRKTGDIHRNRNQNTHEVYAEWMLGANGTWQPANFGDSILRSLDVGKITGGSAAFVDFVSDHLTSNEAVINDLWTEVVRAGFLGADEAIIGGAVIKDDTIDVRHINVTGELTAEIADIIELNVDRLVSTNATMETGVIEQLWTDVVRSRKITTDMLIVGAGDNALGNPSFAEDGNGWSTPALASFPGSGGMGDGACLRLGSSATQRGSYYGISAGDRDLRPTVTPGETFRFTGWVRCGGKTIPTNGARIFVRWYDETGESWIPPLESIGNEAPIPAGTWTKVEGQLTAPEGAASVAMGLFAQGTADGIIYWSNPAIVRAADSSLVVDGAITAKKITITGDENNPDEAGLVANIASIMELDVGNLVALKGTIDEGVINELWTKVVRSQKITTDMLLVGSGVNMIVDPGFLNPELTAYRASLSQGPWNEIGPSPYGGTSRFRIQNYSGTAQLELRDNDNPGNIWAAVNPGETYRIKYRAVQTTAANATSRPAIRYRRSDGTLGYVGAGAYQPVESDLTKIDTAWMEFTWTAPADAVEASLVIQVQGVSAGACDIVSPSMTVSGASLIVDGTIGADKIIANEIGAAVGEFVEITADQIKAGTLSAAVTVSGRIQTATSGTRAVMDSQGFHYYDLFNRELFSASNGRVEMTGSLRTGWSSNEGVLIEPYSSSAGNGIIKFPAVGLAYPAHLALDKDTYGTWLSLVGPGYSGATALPEINFRGSTNGDGEIALLGRRQLQYRAGRHIFDTGATTNTNFVFRVSVNNETFEIDGNGNAYLTPAYNQTTSQATGNVYVSSSGRLTRATSLAASKIVVEDVEDWEAVKTLRPVTYYDKEQAERLADAYMGKIDLSEVERQTQQIGLIAEEVEATGITGIATYSAEGELNGVAYDRLSVALIPWLREHDAELAALREEIASLRGA